MQKTGAKIIAAVTSAIIGLCAFILAAIFPSYSGDAEKVAGKFREKLSERIVLLESRMDAGSGELPEDMVIYTYRNKVLTDWENRFPIDESWLISALQDLPDTDYRYAAMGTDRYMLRVKRSADSLVCVAGLLLPEKASKGYLPAGYRTDAPDSGAGLDICVRGETVLKLEKISDSGKTIPNFYLAWVGYLGLMLASLFWISERPTRKRFRATMFFDGALTAASYAAGFFWQGPDVSFSPELSGIGHPLYSVGVFELANAYVFSLCYCVTAYLDEKNKGKKIGLWRKLSAALTLVAVLVYVQLSLSLITEKTGITLDINNLTDVTGHGVYLLLSYLLLLLSVPILLRVVLDRYSSWAKILLSAAVATYFVLTAAVLRYRNEVVLLERNAPQLVSGNAGMMSDIENKYSFAVYHNRHLLSSEGKYPFPMLLKDKLPEFNRRKYRDFSYQVSDTDVVVFVRPMLKSINILISITLVSLVFILMLSVLVVASGRKRKVSEIGFFERRLKLSSLTMISLTVLISGVLATVFIIQNNREFTREILTNKLSGIQASVQGIINKNYRSDKPNSRLMIELLSYDTKTNISLYSTDGRLIFRTGYGNARPKWFLLDKNALSGIYDQKKSYEIIVNDTEDDVWYDLYAPISGEDGELLAIMQIPYTGIRTYEIRKEATDRVMALLAIMILVMLAAKFGVELEFRSMAEPIRQLSRKMQGASLSRLEHINYYNDDEIKPIVDNYNAMIDRLIDNSRQLSENERNQAWTEMARQVAHEIKNPLTPMKLQIQRMIRLKEMGDSGWSEKFDDVSKVLLEHITILNQTAEDFSNFAKLYSEEAVDVNLDELLRMEIKMFDGREDIEFRYDGIDNAIVSAPKPQLTRVFVNMINNAVQAMDNRETKIINVKLKKSSMQDFYEIIIEDNGPGVAPENVDKLFSPNFTTKGAGGGLGLAISKNILETCGATISYSKSPVLGGACFSICFPRIGGGYQIKN